jgi:hypothetical protein
LTLHRPGSDGHEEEDVGNPIGGEDGLALVVGIDYLQFVIPGGRQGERELPRVVAARIGEGDAAFLTYSLQSYRQYGQPNVGGLLQYQSAFQPVDLDLRGRRWWR